MKDDSFYDNMSAAIELSSPSGSMSKRARRAAEKRLHDKIFGAGYTVQAASPKQPNRAETCLRQAKELRELAIRGMKPRAYIKKAIALENEAKEIKQV